MPDKVQNPRAKLAQTISVTELSLEHLPETLGIGEATPRLSWVTQTDLQNWQQAAYEIEVFRVDGTHSSGRIDSRESVLQPWPFGPLKSRERVELRVRVWGQDGSSSGWSEPLQAEAGLLKSEDWQARFVGPTWPEDPDKAEPSPYLRHAFKLRGEVKKARLYISALGVYEPYLNGKIVGDHVLAPGWTSYSHRLRYQTFDVTDHLQTGSNVIGALLGDGWYRGRLGFGSGRRNIYGNKLALLAQLEVEYQDGSTEIISTNDQWKAQKSPILASEIYNGETYDARLELPAWAEPGFDDSAWSGAALVEHNFATLFAPVGPPVRRIETVAPVKIWLSPSGKTLVDFGQNLVGWLRIKVQGQAGHTITLKHAEVLEHGELGTRPLRFAAATDHYTLKGRGLEVWEPHFTFHGFRYTQVENWPGELKPEDLEAIVIHSDMRRTGWFECSDLLVNQLHQNVVWSMRGNFLDVPTDCPQRDERLGWTGDIQVFSPTASFLYDVNGFLSSWLADLAADQDASGAVPAVIPHILPVTLPAAAWGDAVTVVPWVLYGRYGDTRILQQQFDSMKAWVEFMRSRTGESLLWDRDFQFGDWLDPAAPPSNPAAARTLPGLVATAYFARSAEILGLTARVLDRAEDEARYLALAAQVREAFRREYVTPNGRVLSDSSTAYALALEFALLPSEQERKNAARRLCTLVQENGYLISTGFVGTPLICDALTHMGEAEAAYRLLMQRECPSWLYPVTMGATTVWERWDSMLPDGSINPGEMTSFNHYALGAIADWLHRSVAGLAPAAPGYRRIEICPIPGGGLSSASARHLTPYGEAACAWKIEAGQIELRVVIPPNTTALVILPGSGQMHEVGSGSYRWTYLFASPSMARPKVTLDSDFDTLYSHPEAWALVNRMVREHSPDHLGGFRRSLQSNLEGSSIRTALWGVPHGEELLEKLEGALDGL